MKRSQSDRRDVAEQGERAIEPRLAGIPKSIWANKTNSAGLNIQQVVDASIMHNRTTCKNLPAKFWHHIFVDFQLGDGSAADLLPEPDDEFADTPTTELLEALAELHSDNPVAVSSVPLERFLAHCESLHATDTYGLMHAVMPGEISHLNAVKAQVAVLSFWARLGLSRGAVT